MSPRLRPRSAAILLVLAFLVLGGGEWVPRPATIETVAGDTYVSFQPVVAARILLEGARVREKDLRIYGVRGRVREFDLEEAPRGTWVRFDPPADVAEITALDLVAPKLRVLVPAAAIAPRRAPAPGALEALGEFKITFYWVALEGEPGKEPADTPLLDPEGRELGRFTRSFVKRVGIEGTGKLRDGRVINVSGKEGAFEVVRCPNGLGTAGYHLIPYRSVAVDRDVVPIGTPLYLPAAVGAKLPDGTVHDGRFWAHDVGGGIDGWHLDLFTGAGDRREPLEKAGVKNLKTTAVFAIRE